MHNSHSPCCLHARVTTGGACNILVRFKSRLRPAISPLDKDCQNADNESSNNAYYDKKAIHTVIGSDLASLTEKDARLPTQPDPKLMIPCERCANN